MIESAANSVLGFFVLGQVYSSMDDPEKLRNLIEDVIRSRDVLYLWTFLLLPVVAGLGFFLDLRIDPRCYLASLVYSLCFIELAQTSNDITHSGYFRILCFNKSTFCVVLPTVKIRKTFFTIRLDGFRCTLTITKCNSYHPIFLYSYQQRHQRIGKIHAT
jgi:hypothetical protein